MILACRKSCGKEKLIQSRTVNNCSMGVFVVGVGVMIVCRCGSRRVWMDEKRRLFTACPRRRCPGNKHEQTIDDDHQLFHLLAVKTMPCGPRRYKRRHFDRCCSFHYEAHLRRIQCALLLPRDSAAHVGPERKSFCPLRGEVKKQNRVKLFMAITLPVAGRVPGSTHTVRHRPAFHARVTLDHRRTQGGTLQRLPLGHAIPA